jgi:selT/selW/selH-like putative selenoprotein
VAHEVKEAFGIEVNVSLGPTGSFNVLVNGEIIFNKTEENRFPETGEVVRIIMQKYPDMPKETDGS